MNAQLNDGTAVKCKRRGLKIVLSVGTQKGDGLMLRLGLSRRRHDRTRSAGYS